MNTGIAPDDLVSMAANTMPASTATTEITDLPVSSAGARKATAHAV
jgi:hypothetical protein